MPQHKDYHLTVRNDFGPYRKGDHIEDEAEVNRILGDEAQHHVIRVAADNPPEPKPAKPLPVAPEPAQVAPDGGKK
jgi:hypothetical protein